MKKHLAYTLQSDKVNLILASDGRNEQVHLSSILMLWKLILSTSGLFSSLRVFKYLKDSNKITWIFCGKSCSLTLQFIEWKAKIKFNSTLCSLDWVFHNYAFTLEFEYQIWGGDIFGYSQYRYYLKPWNRKKESGKIREDERHENWASC